MKLGELKMAFKLTKGNAAAAATAAGVDPRTARRYAKRRWKADANQTRRNRTKKVVAAVAARRKHLVKYTKETVSKGSRTWPRHGTARALAEKLFLDKGIRVSRRTVQRDMKSSGLRSFVRPKVPTRTAKDLHKRRAFGVEMRRWSAKKLKSIVFSDESWLTTNEHTTRTQYAKSRDAVLPRERKCRWNVCSLQCWGAIGHNYKSALVIFPAKHEKNGELKPYRLDSSAYVRRCLSTVATSLIRERRTFMQDGARAHASKNTLRYLKRKRIAYLEDWPPYSPDLNPIERMWNELQQRVGSRCPQSQEELVRIAHEEWKALPMTLINAHVAHFETQLQTL